MWRIQELCSHEWTKDMKKPMQEGENSVDKSSANSGQVAGAREGGAEVVAHWKC